MANVKEHTASFLQETAESMTKLKQYRSKAAIGKAELMIETEPSKVSQKLETVFFTVSQKRGRVDD